MGEFEPAISRIVTLSKPSQRQLQPDKIALQTEQLLASVNTGARTRRGWTVEVVMQGSDYNPKPYRQDYNYSNAIQGQYLYTVLLRVTCKPSTERTTLEAEFQNIVNALISRAATAGKWTVAEIDGKPYEAKATEELAAGIAENVGYAPITIPDDWPTYFSHLYGLDAQILRIQRSLQLGVMSGWATRAHCALIGPPGCGKSDICQSIKLALGEEAVLEFDGTSTTMAGAQKELNEREELPRVLLVEEIEKAPDNALPWLLSALDLRAEIRKTTARGNIMRDTHMLAIATVNDIDAFKRAQYGALASRFANKIGFQRPPRALLERILTREVERIDGDAAWIKPTLDYVDANSISDPREVIAICLTGREMLISGQYQEVLTATSLSGWE